MTLYWYKEKPIVYTYRMTVVASLIAENGIAFVSDGRVNDFNENIIEDRQVKLFELSPMTVLMPANGAADNMEFIMSALKGIFEHGKLVYLNDIATQFLLYCRVNVVTEPIDRVPLFTLGGYNLNNDGTYEAKIYLIQFNGIDWEAFESKGNDTFVAQGASGDTIRKFLSEEYTVSKDKTLNARNILALKAIEIGEKNSPQYVGGQTSLWNLNPTTGLRKFTNAEINKLRKAII